MKRKGGLFMCLVGGLVGVLSCALKKMPDGELVSVEYTRSGTMAGYVYGVMWNVTPQAHSC